MKRIDCSLVIGLTGMIFALVVIFGYAFPALEAIMRSGS
jgi:hypothetical protein